MNKHQPYKSCNCRVCRGANSKTKRDHKVMAHRNLRHKNRQALHEGKDILEDVATGYKR